MSEQQNPLAPLGPPAAADPARGSGRWKKTAAALGLAGVAGIGGLVAVTAANAEEPATSAAAGELGTQNAAGAQRPGPGHGAGFGRGLAGALHGEFVVENEDGSIATRQLQRGEVTALDEQSLTVLTTDGYSATYALGPDPEVTGVADVAVGDTLTVIATVAGDTVTVDSVRTGTGGPPAGGGRDGAPRPAPTDATDEPSSEGSTTAPSESAADSSADEPAPTTTTTG